MKQLNDKTCIITPDELAKIRYFVDKYEPSDDEEIEWRNSILDSISDTVSNEPVKLRNVDMPYCDTLAHAKRYYIEHGCKDGIGFYVDGQITNVPYKSNFEKWLLEPAPKCAIDSIVAKSRQK